ncbi:MAG: hypothetical protein QM758_22260 [Armatimonas sp.]
MSRWFITLLALFCAMGAQAQFPKPPAPPRPPSLPGNAPLPPAPKVPPLPNPSPRATNVNGPVVKAKRALLVVSAGLKKHGDPKYGALYQFLESSGASSAREGLSGVYGKIVVLEGRDGTVEKFLSTLYSLARDHDAVDMVLHQHGLPGQLVFEDKAVSVEDIGKSIRDGTDNKLGKCLTPRADIYALCGKRLVMVAAMQAAGQKQALKSSLGQGRSMQIVWPVFLPLWPGGAPDTP